MKNTKSKLLFSILSLVVCYTMLMGTTFAWYYDSASTGANKIQAGNLDVQLLMYNGTDYVDIGDNSTPIFSSENSTIAQNNNTNTLWEPSKTQVAYLAIKNNGTLNLKYKVALDVTNPENGKNLYEVMRYAITPDANDDNRVAEWDEGTTQGLAVQEGRQIVASDVSIGPGSTHYFALSVHMPYNADNKYQNGKVEFDLTVFATQVSSESDTFGNDYDINAAYPGMSVNEFKNALDDSATERVIASDLTIEENITVPENKTLFSNGATFSSDVALRLNANSKVVLNGNTKVTATVQAIQAKSENAKVIINDGTYSAPSGIGVGSSAQIEINGGTFTVGVLADSDDGSNTARVVINGGTFHVTNAIKNENVNLVINGGTFDKNPTQWLGAGHTATQNADNTWTVN